MLFILPVINANNVFIILVKRIKYVVSMKLKINKDKFKKVLKIVLVLLVLASISVGLYFLLRHFGLTDVNVLKGYIKQSGPWAILVYISLRVVMTIFLSFMPACSMIFDLLSLATFDYLPPFLIFLIRIRGLMLSMES